MTAQKRIEKPGARTAGKRAARRKPARRAQLAAPGKPGTLSLKRRRAAAALITTAKGNKTQACRDAGYAESTATDQAARVFGDPRVQGEVVRLLHEQGGTPAHVALRFREALDAMETEFYKGAPVADVVAHKIRLDAVELYLEATGQLVHKLEIAGVAKEAAERIVQVVKRYVPADRFGECLNEIVAAISGGAGGGVASARATG